MIPENSIIFLVGILMAVAVVGLIPALIGLPNDLPYDITNVFHQIVAGLFIFDFILPVQIMLNVFLSILGLEIALMVADGAIWVWKMIKRMHA